MPSIAISAMPLLPAVTDDTMIPCIDPVDATVNYKTPLKTAITKDLEPGLAYVDSEELASDPQIVRTGPGELQAESLASNGDLSGGSLFVGDLTTNAIPFVNGAQKLTDAPGLTVDGTNGIIVAGNINTGSISFGSSGHSIDPAGIADLETGDFTGDVTANSVAADNIKKNTFTNTNLICFDGGGFLVDAVGVTADGLGNLRVTDQIETGNLRVAAGGATIDGTGNIIAATLNANNGFTGTGSYATLTIVNGIITAAS